MGKSTKTRHPAMVEPWGICEIRVAGFKSIADEQSIAIRPLTILAGVNSSGKSSMMQPLLLLKQTLESTYDPGTLLLNGPNVKFTATDQLLSRIGKRHSSDTFHVGMHSINGESFQTSFRKEHKMGFRIDEMEIADTSGTFTVWPEMTPDEIIKSGITKGRNYSEEAPDFHKNGQWKIMRERCFLEPAWVAKGSNSMTSFVSGHMAGVWETLIPRAIHVPGLRANPERTYQVTAVGPSFPGTFDKYTASLISEWMSDSEATFTALNADLKLLELTGGVTAVRVNDVQIELHVGRLRDVPPTRKEDRVNIVDVGVGVSQLLPVLVALHAAMPRTLVYIEQPETHLHPQAQFVLAQVLAAAAQRGVRVVAETHSTMLLLGVQALVAEGKLDADIVKLHWFERDKEGRTTVRPGDLDEAGAFGEWPQDFDDVTLKAQKKYLDAADKRMFAR